MQQRIEELDALRGLAAFSVVIFHYIYRYDALYGPTGMAVDWAFYGQYGVQLFFIISGFVIYWTLSKVKKPSDFIVSRFSRLYPLYWACVLLTFVFVTLANLPGREIAWQHALINTLMFHEYFYIPHVDGVYWTLTIELTFYTWAFVFYRVGCTEKMEWLFVPAMALGVLEKLDVVELRYLVGKIFMVGYISFFVAGICFYKIWANKSTGLTSVVLFLSLASSILTQDSSAYAPIVLFYVVFFLVVKQRCSILKIRPIIFVGSVSYALYLVHQNIGYIILNYLKNTWIHPFMAVFIAGVITLFLAWWLTRFIEQPILRKIRNWYTRSSSERNSNVKVEISGS